MQRVVAAKALPKKGKKKGGKKEGKKLKGEVMLLRLAFELAATRRGENKEEKGGGKLKIKIMLLRLAFELAATRRRFPLPEREKNRDKTISRWARDAAKARVL